MSQPIRAFFLVGVLAIAGAPAAQASGQLFGSDRSSDNLLTVDASSGAGTAVGALGYGSVEGLAYDRNTLTLYGVDPGSDILISIDTTTGAGTTIGSLGVNVSNTGLAFDPGSDTLYLTATTSSGGPSLYRVDTATGAASRVGYVGVVCFGLAFDPNSNTLYGVHDGDYLWTVNPGTGQATGVGSLGVNVRYTGMAFDAETDTLYMADEYSDRLYTVNTSTGAATLVGSLGYNDVQGLAFVDQPSPNVDLHLAKSESADPVVVDSSLTYTVRVTNSGLTTATGLTLSEALTLPSGVTIDSITPSAGTTYAPANDPDGTWTVGTLAMGETATLTVVLTVGAAASAGIDEISDTVAVTALAETNDGDTSVTESTSVTRGRLFGSDVDIDDLLTISASSGAGTSVGDLGFDFVDGLAYDRNTETLYGVNYYDRLISIDTSTGVGTDIGYVGFDLYKSGLAFDPNSNTLYLCAEYYTGSQYPRGLFTVDTATGAATLVGDPGQYLIGLAFDPNSDTLYGITPATDSLYTVNPSTAAATLVGALGVNAYWGLGAAFDPGTDTLYLVDIGDHSSYSEPSKLFTVDTSTGAATWVGELGFDDVSALAFEDQPSPNVDLDIAKSESADPVSAGSGAGNLTYTVTVRNRGFLTATGLTLSEALTLPSGVTIDSITPSSGTTYAPANDPNGTWTVGSLALTESATLTVVLTVGASAAAGTGVISDTVTVTALNETNDGATSASEGTSVVRLVDLQLTKVESVDPVYAGSGAGNLTYTVTATNNGPLPATGLTLSEALTLPSGVTIDSITPSAGTSYAPANDPNGTWTVGTVAAAGSATLTVVLTVAETAATGTDVISDTVTVTALAETNTGDNAVSESTTILGLDATYGLFGADDSTDNLLTINEATGAAFGFGSLGFGNVHGLAFDRNSLTLYGVDYATNSLISIDVSTGAGTTIGSLSGASAYRAGLAFDPNTDTLYLTNYSSLYTVDVATGAATYVGNTSYYLYGLAFDPDSGTLYGISDSDRLYTVNTATGSVTQVGYLGVNVRYCGAAFDPETDTLYLTDEYSDSLYTVDTSTGTATLVGSLGYNDVQGLAFVAQPSSNVDLRISKSESADPVIANSNLTYTVTVRNRGYASATGLTLSEALTLPSGVTIDSITPSAGTTYAPPNGANGTWTVGSLTFSETATLTVELTVSAAAAAGTDVISDTATVTALNETNDGDTSVTESTSITRTRLFGSDISTDNLLAVDATSGAGAALGALGFSQVEGLAYDGNTGTLYGVDYSSNNLISIDPATGAGTTIGYLSGAGAYRAGLAFDPNTDILYLTYSRYLYTVDVATGAATSVGYTSYYLDGLAFDPNSGTLYGISDNDYLYIVDTATGSVTQVGYLGVNVSYTGAAFDPETDTLYLSDVNTDNLYTVNTSTGAATLVGSLGYADVRGLALMRVPSPNVDLDLTKSESADPVVADSSLTYTVRVRNLGLTTATGLTLSEALTVPADVTITSITPSAGTTYAPANDANGTWTVGTLARGESATLTVVLAVSGTAAAGTDVISDTVTVTALAETNDGDTSVTESTSITRSYLVGADLSTDNLLTVDASTGAGTSVGALGYSNVYGLAHDRNTSTLYGVDYSGNNLISIDPATGAGTTIGSLSGASAYRAGLAFDPNTDTLYLTYSRYLYTVDVATGAATSVGYTSYYLDGLAFDPDSDTLYGISDNDYLYTVDTATGSVTQVGYLGVNVSYTGAAFDAETDTLYMTDNNTDRLYTVDTSTGAATQVGSLGYNDVQGLAFARLPSPNVDLDLAKSESADPVIAGSGAGNLTYTVTVTNRGYTSATGLTLSEALTLPSGVTIDSITPSAGTSYAPANDANGTWTAGTLAFSESATLTVVLTVADTAAAGTDVISDTVTVTALNESNDGDVAVTESTSVLRPVDLRLTKVESADPVYAGSGAGNLTYTVTATNVGPLPATGLTLSEALTVPSGVTIDSITPSAGTSYAPANDPDGTWTVGTLAVSGSATLTVVLTAGDTAASGDDAISDTVTVTALAETNTGDTSVSESTSVLGVDASYGLLGADDATDNLLTLNETSGAATAIGGLGFGNVHGMAYDRNTLALYGVDYQTNNLISVDPATGAGTAIGSLGVSAYRSGLAFDPSSEILYLTTSSSLYTVDVATGAATYVGYTSYYLYGLAFDPDADTLYGISDNDYLYTVDTGTGTVTQVGYLGVNVRYAGAAFDPETDTLYLADEYGDNLYTVNTSTGTATLVGSLGYSDVQGLAFVSQPSLNVDLFLTKSESADPVIADSSLTYTVKLINRGLTTAAGLTLSEAVTVPSDVSITSITPSAGTTYAPANDPDGTWTVGTLATGDKATLTVVLAVAGTAAAGTDVISDTVTVTALNETNDGDTTVTESTSIARAQLFGSDISTDELLTVSTSTGAAAAVGGLSFSQVEGLAYDPNTSTLYGVDASSDRLISVDPATGAGTAIGYLNAGNFYYGGLAFDPGSNTLYLAGRFSSGAHLYTVDTATGAATYVGNTSYYLYGLAFDPDSDTLYGIYNDRLYTVDTETGAVTQVGYLGVYVSYPGAAFDSETDTLYLTDTSTDSLYTVDTSSGAATLVGSLGFNDVRGLAFLQLPSPNVALEITKSESADPVTAGSGAGNLTYTVTVANRGYTSATGLTLSEALTLPSGVTIDSITPSAGTSYAPANDANGTWTVGTLAQSESATLTVVLTAADTAAAGTDVISDTVTVTALAETNDGDASVTESTSVLRPVDLRLTKVESADPVYAGTGAGNLTYIVTATNNGPLPATGLTLSEALTLPSGVTIDSITPSAGTSYAPANDPNGTWTVGTLAVAGSATLTVVLTVGETTATGTDVISGTVTVTAVAETNTGDTSVSESTTVLGLDASYGLFGADASTDSLLSIDETSGASFALGGLGFDYVYGLAYDRNSLTLYGVDDATDNLISIDPATGAGTAIGPLGVSPSQAGLAFNPNTDTLYLTTSRNLYTVDLATGAATSVGYTSYYLYGLAFDPDSDTLYGISDQYLYTVDTTTGSATEVGYLGEYVRYNGAAFDPETDTLYLASERYDRLYTVDTSTGAATQVGSLGYYDVQGLAFVDQPSPNVDLRLTKSESADPVVADSSLTYTVEVRNGGFMAATGLTLSEALTLPSGVTVDSITPSAGTTYAPANDPDGTWTVDTLAFSESATLTVELAVGGTAAAGIDVISGTVTVTALNETNDGDTSVTESTSITRGLLFGSDISTDDLLTVNAGTGAAASAGDLGFYQVEGLAHDPNTSTLYGVDANNDQLLSIDPATGAGTAIGYLNAGNFYYGGLAFDPGSNTLYLAGRFSSGARLYTVDTATGAATYVGNTSYYLYGLAFDPDSDTLYGIYEDRLFTVDTGTGAVTQVGYLGVYVSYPGAAFDAETDTLYVSDENQDRLYTVNTSTGAATEVGSLGFQQVRGLASLHLPSPNVDLEITKSESADPVPAGTSLTYTVTVANRGYTTATGLTLSEALTLPSAVTISSITPSAGTSYAPPNDAGGTWTVGTLAYSESATLTVTLAVGDSTAAGTDVISGTVTVTALNETNDGDTSASESTSVVRLVDLQLMKEESADPVYAGSGAGNLTYTVTATNNGPVPATGLTLSEALTVPSGVTIDSITPSAGTTYAPANDPDGTWTVGTLTAAGSATLTVVLTVGDTAAAGTDVISDTVTVTALNETNTGDTSVSESTSVLGADASHGLFGADESADRLLSIDATSGVAVGYGSLGFDNVHGLAYDRNTLTLYGVDYATESLISIDPATGAGTAIGSLGSISAYHSGLAFDPNTDTLYLTSNDDLYAVDVATGAATHVGYASEYLYGLAFDANTDTLYGISTDYLYTVDTGTGAATYVGYLGVYVRYAGAAFDPDTDTLYVTDEYQDRLYTVDTSTGTATQVGSLGYTDVQGLAFVDQPSPNVDLVLTKSESADPVLAGNSLTYTVKVRNGGSATATGLTLSEELTLPSGVTISSITPSAGTTYAPANDPDGTWTVGTLAFTESATLTVELAVSAAAAAGTDLISDTATVTALNETNDGDTSVTESTSITRSQLYGSDIDTDHLLTVSKATGAGTSAGALGFSQVEGLAYDPDTSTLYGVDYATESLISIDPATGAGAAIGSLSGASAYLAGLAFDPNTDTLYLTYSRNLYTVDTATGAATSVGYTSYYLYGLAFDSDSDTLYGISDNDYLYTVDTGTGAATQIGYLGVNVRYTGAAFDPETDTLYLADEYQDRLYTVDTSTGSATLVGSLGSGNVRGLAVASGATAAECGNGAVEPGEGCDDGNTTGGDGCSATCQVEECGNGVADVGEACDDGNLVDGDGCDSNCTVTACGNDIVTAGEQCDDGNTTPADGCSATCQLEVCGNGTVDPGEACDDGNTVGGDGCSADCTSIEPADLTITQVESADPVTAGSGTGNLTYIVTVTNSGPAPATGLALSEVLTLPSGVAVDSITPSGGTSYAPPNASGTWTIGTLAASSSATLTVVLTVDATAAPGTDVISSTVTVTALNENNNGDTSATASTSIARQVGLTLTGTESADPVTAGSGTGNLTYVITATNNGPSEASGLTLSEALTLPSGVTVDSITPSAGTGYAPPNATGTWTVGTLGVSASATLTVVLTVDATTVAGTDVISGTVTVTALNEPNTGDTSVTEATSVIRSVDLELTKTESADPVTAGSGAGNLTYTVTVMNNGPSDASGLELSEALTLPSGVTIDSITPSGSTSYAPPDASGTWTVGDLAESASETLTVVLTVGPSTAAGTDVISGTATVSALTETNSGDTSATEATSVILEADLSVTQSDSPDPVPTLSTLTYTITVNNAGPSDALNVVVTDNLPAGLSSAVTSGCAEDPAGVPFCSLGTIAAGGSDSYTIAATVDLSAAGTLSNTATASSDTPDPEPGNDSATEETTVDCPDPATPGLYGGFTASDCASSVVKAKNQTDLDAYLADFGMGTGTKPKHVNVMFNPVTTNMTVISPCRIKVLGLSKLIDVAADNVCLYGRAGVTVGAGTPASGSLIDADEGRITMVSEEGKVQTKPGIGYIASEMTVEADQTAEIGTSSTLDVAGPLSITSSGTTSSSQALIQTGALVMVDSLTMTAPEQVRIGDNAGVDVTADLTMISSSDAAEIQAAAMVAVGGNLQVSGLSCRIGGGADVAVIGTATLAAAGSASASDAEVLSGATLTAASVSQTAEHKAMLSGGATIDAGAGNVEIDAPICVVDGTVTAGSVSGSCLP